jgi:hypothetical protein
MKLENRAKPSATRFCCVSGLTVILFFVGTGLLFSYFFIDFNNVGDTEYSSISFTAKYSLDEMRSFAYKNSLSKNYKPSLYLKWNLSFNRIFEDSENRLVFISFTVIYLLALIGLILTAMTLLFFFIFKKLLAQVLKNFL